MADQTLDVTNFISERKFSKFSGRVLALCMLLQICDGIDLQAIGYVGPGLRDELHLSAAQMGPVFSAGLFGLMFGALIFGPLSDKLGRRPVMIAAVFLFGVFSLACATITGATDLMIWRFLAGLGFGAALPNSLGMIAEYMPARGRYTLMGLSSLGFIGGGVFSGWIAIALLPHFGWRSVFIAGGLLSVVVGFIVALWLPESLRFMASHGNQAGARKLLHQVDPAFTAPEGVTLTVQDADRKGLPMRHLFTEGRARLTIPFWIAAFVVLLELYLMTSWIPILTKDEGIPIQQGVFIASLFQVGAAFAGVSVGLLMDRISPFKVLAGFACCALLAVIAVGLVGANPTMLMVTVFIAGYFIVGCQGCLNQSTATMYPTYVRVTGVGWMLGIGRIGSVIGPIFGGAVLGAGVSPTTLFLVAALPLVIPVGAALYMNLAANGFQQAARGRAALNH